MFEVPTEEFLAPALSALDQIEININSAKSVLELRSFQKEQESIIALLKLIADICANRIDPWSVLAALDPVMKLVGSHAFRVGAWWVTAERKRGSKSRFLEIVRFDLRHHALALRGAKLN